MTLELNVTIWDVGTPAAEYLHILQGAASAAARWKDEEMEDEQECIRWGSRRKTSGNQRMVEHEWRHVFVAVFALHLPCPASGGRG